MKRKALALTIILALLVTTQVGWVNANFYSLGTTPPPPEATPPKIIVTYPENLSDAILKSNESLSFKIIRATCTTKYAFSGGTVFYYKGDWMANECYLFSSEGTERTRYSVIFNIPLNNLTSGIHAIVVRASQHFWYGREDGAPYDFNIESSSINLTFSLIDVTPPNVSILSMESKKYATSDVPLNFTVNELVSQFSYSLDGQDNVTIAGNITLRGLSNGEHNIAVYATDIAGNTNSETKYFSVEVPFPTVSVIASVAAVAVGALGLLFYFKKRNHAKTNKHSETAQSSS